MWEIYWQKIKMRDHEKLFQRFVEFCFVEPAKEGFRRFSLERVKGIEPSS
ncbi:MULTISPECIES: hypothetical protein [unclassified Janthinobacterium]|nr:MULTISPECIES: hypothetical protein [unclassified Janthinobacterium]MEC5161676.1 hypothetical protein [Janthinobacterium sp. CG_S6]